MGAVDKKPSKIRLFFKVLLGFIIFTFIGISFFFLTFNPNSYRQKLADEFAKALGHPVSIGALDMKLSFVPTIEMKNVVVYNNQPFDTKTPLLSMDRVKTQLMMVPFFKGDIRMTDFSVNIAKLNILSQNGKNNLQVYQNIKNKTPENVSFFVNKCNFEMLSVIYKSEHLAKSFLLSKLSIVDHSQIKAVLKIDNQENLNFSGSTSNLLHLFHSSPFSFNFNLKHNNANMQLSGAFDLKEEIPFKLEIKGDFTDPNTLFFVPLVLKNHLPKEPGALSGFLTFKNHIWNLQKGKIVFDSDKSTIAIDTVFDYLNNEHQYKGTASFFDLAKFYLLKPFVLNFDLSRKDNFITLNNIDFQADSSNLNVVGKFLNAEKPQFNFIAKSELLDFNSIFMPDGDIQKITPFIENVLNNYTIQSYIRLNNIKLPYFEDYVSLNTDFVLKDKNLTTSKLYGNVLLGTYLGALDILAQEKQIDLKGWLDLNNLNFTSFSNLNAIAQNLHGSGKIKFDSQGAFIDLKENLNCTMQWALKGDKILYADYNNLSLVKKLLNAKTNAFGASIADMQDNLKCAFLDMNYQNNAFDFKNVAIQTEALSLKAQGVLNNKELDLKIYPYLTENNSDIDWKKEIIFKGNVNDLKPEINSLNETLPNNPGLECQNKLKEFMPVPKGLLENKKKKAEIKEPIKTPSLFDTLDKAF